MKKYLFLLLMAVAIMPQIFAQKCKYDINKADGMTGEIHKAIFVRLLYNPLMDRQWHLTLEKMGDNYFLSNDIVLQSHLDEVLQKGDSLMLKLESGKIITCYARSNVQPKKSGSGTSSQQPITEYASTYPITSDLFSLLASQKCTLIQMNIGPLKYNYEIKEKTSKVIQTSASCILE